MKPEVIFMIGYPCCGKTTYIKKNYPNHKINSYDDIMCEMYPASSYNESFKLANYKEVIKECLKRLDKNIEMRDNIVMDWTNLSRKSRGFKIRKFPRDYKKIAIVIMTKKDILFNRNRERSKQGKTIPDSVFENMFKQFQMPKTDEGFDVILREFNGDSK